MKPEILHDNAEIASFFHRNTSLHFYSIGDLDPFFRPRCTYYGLREEGDLRAVILLYRGAVTTLLALGSYPKYLRALLRALLPDLPDRFYAHLSPGLETTLRERYRLQPAGLCAKMQLVNKDALETVETDGVMRLHSSDDIQTVQTFLDEAYPGNWFDPTMLSTGHYYGVWEHGKLIGVSGVHLYSEEYGVAAIGNIAVDMAHRGQGIGEQLVARLCRELARNVDFVGLNVKVNNEIALALYGGLGFKTTNHYGEFFAGE